MNHKRILLLFTLFGFALVSNAQLITLQQAVDMSIKNSNNLKIANAKILIANADVQEAKDRQLPNVSVNGSYLRLAGANFQLKNSGAVGGGLKVNQVIYGLVNASLPIYAAGKIKYGIQATKYVEDAARLAAIGDKEGTSFNTIAAYTNIYKAAAAVNVIKENMQAAVQRDVTFSRLEQNGLLARNDLLKSQLQTSNIELALLDAENNYTIAKISMALLIGLPENSNIQIDTNFINKIQALKPFADYENLALQNRKDLQVNTLQQKATTTAIKIAKADTYPTVVLNGGYINADIPKVLSITNALNIGVGVQYNIASLWKANTKLTQAKARSIQLSATQNLLIDGIRLQINKDYQNCLLAQKKIEVLEKAILQATENTRITKNKYDNSLVNITELLDANVLLLQTKLNASAAKADAALAYNKLLETTGTLAK